MARASTGDHTWTLGGRSVKFALMLAVGFDSKSLEVAIQDSLDREEYLVARRLPGAQSPTTIEVMPISELFVGSRDDADEVTQWLREEPVGEFELFFDERVEEGGNVLRFYFRFHDIGDALKFKLRFAHNLDAGAVAE